MDAEPDIPQSSDIGELHPSLDNGGNAHQTSQSNITLPAPAEQALRQHTLQRPSPLTTSALRRLGRAPTPKLAFSELRRKSIIAWEDATIPIDNPLLIWDPPAHYLDSTCIVGTAGAGFSPIILPGGGRKVPLSCKLHMAGRQMRDKYLPVEWDYHGRTYFVGFLESKQVWLLFQPDDPDQVENDSSSRSTALNTLRQRRFSLFWGSVLQFLPGVNVAVRDQYADCTSDEEYKVASNLMERNTDDPQLSAHTLSILQNTFERKYETWARGAPWRGEDSFFLDSTPILVVYQYGQNQRIFNQNHHEERYEAEVSAFANEYNWPQVWLFTYAIATTVRAREASHFEASEKLRATEPLYSSPDEETREEFTLTDLLEAIKTQSCPPVFDKDGNEIQPYEPVFIGQNVDCGIVLNFDQVPTQIQAAEEDTSPPQYTTFPLAFCRGIGNCQASTHLQFYQAFVDRVNRQLQEENEDLWDTPVKRGPHQLYNEIAHKTRARDGLHDSQRGYVTAAMGGKGLQGANLVASYLRSRQACSLQLPSQSYQGKLLLVGHYIGLRSEPTVTINVQALPEHQRHGRFIYESIMRVGCDIYMEEETWAEFCNLLVVFKPLMWPGILNWATIPISAAIESLWEEFESKPDAMETQWDEVELACLLERLLVFAQTGNAQVIQGALSEAFGLRHSLETTGFPTFSSALDVTGSTPKIRQGYWPSQGADHQAVTGANATLQFHYNESVSQTHTAKATLGLLSQRARFSSATNAATQLA